MHNAKSLVFFIAIVCICSGCGLFINRYNKNGQRTGLWKEYRDKKNIHRKGKYKTGLEIGTWKYYDLNKLLIKTETYSKMRDTIYTTTFHPNKKPESSGCALLIYESDSTLHYYWQGWWLYFTELGDTVKKVWYEKGVPTKAER